MPLPFLQNLPPALDVGLEAIIGFLLPVAGDIIGFFLGLYLVFCSWLFGDVPLWVLGQMVRHPPAPALQTTWCSQTCG